MNRTLRTAATMFSLMTIVAAFFNDFSRFWSQSEQNRLKSLIKTPQK